jgi:peptidoglycan/LPS O-acetylase OafA/YrhL
MGLIRIFLASSVVLWHGGGVHGWFPYNGTAAVTLFFIISGFYMALVLNEKYTDDNANVTFWISRILRLWPLFAISSLLMLTVSSEIFSLLRTNINGASAAAIIFSNISMIGYEAQDLLCLSSTGALDTCAVGNQMPIKPFFLLHQGWSLGLELWFYLLAPFFVRRSSSAAIVLLVSAAIFAAVRFMHVNDIWIYRFFPSVLFFFMLGVASYWMAKYPSLTGNKYYLTLGRVMLVVTLFLIAVPNSLTLFSPEQHHNKIFVTLFALFIPAWFFCSKGNSFDNFVGELSYLIYVVHLAVKGWAIRFGIEHEWLAVVMLASSILVSTILLYMVDRPIDRLRQRFVRTSGRRILTPASP